MQSENYNRTDRTKSYESWEHLVSENKLNEVEARYECNVRKVGAIEIVDLGLGRVGLVYHLFLVTSVLRRNDKYPITTHYYVMAEDEKRACSQVRDNAVPEKRPDGQDSHDLVKNDVLTLSAQMIPVQIQGWGCQTF